jgi:hypothetical protein
VIVFERMRRDEAVLADIAVYNGMIHALAHADR